VALIYRDKRMLLFSIVCGAFGYGNGWWGGGVVHRFWFCQAPYICRLILGL